MYQLPREFGSFKWLAGLCVSVYCVCLGSIQYTGGYGCFNCLGGIYIYIFLDQRFTNHVHVVS